MKVVASLFIGYLLGALNPAALLGRLKKRNLRELGSKNLGASNVMLTMGKGYGLLVMVLDIAKAVLAARLSQWLFPKLAVAGMLAGLGAILGHIFPFYMGFHGGKGLAAFGGLVLFYNPWMFAGLLVMVIILMLLVNYSYVAPLSVAVLFPVLVAITSGDLWMTLIAAAAGVIIAAKHWSNIARAKQGKEVKIRDIVTGRYKTK